MFFLTRADLFPAFIENIAEGLFHSARSFSPVSPVKIFRLEIDVILYLFCNILYSSQILHATPFRGIANSVGRLEVGENFLLRTTFSNYCLS